jgi:hypothetical protein
MAYPSRNLRHLFYNGLFSAQRDLDALLIEGCRAGSFCFVGWNTLDRNVFAFQSTGTLEPVPGRRATHFDANH